MTIRWQLWSIDDGVPDVRRVGAAAPDGDGFVRVEVSDLPTGRAFAYRFGLGDTDDTVEWSSTGRTATLDPDASTVRLGVACCARLASGSFDAYASLKSYEPDLVVHLGDYIYEDGGDARSHGTVPDPPHDCRSFDDYLRRYAQYRSDPDLQALHVAAPWVLTLDDHEIDDDASPRPDGSVSDRARAALAARDRWMPQRTTGNGPTAHDRVVSLGRLGELVLVDTRLAGRDPQAGRGPTVVGRRERPRSILSSEQWVWLEEIVARQRSGWLLLASQVQVAPMRLGWAPRMRPPGIRPIVNPDQWDGYPGDRLRLVELLDRYGVERVAVLSGDLHARFVTASARRSCGGDGRTRLLEFTTPSVSAPTYGELLARRLPLPQRWLTAAAELWLRLLNPHIDHVDLTRHGATVVDVTATALTVSALGSGGDVLASWRFDAERIGL